MNLDALTTLVSDASDLVGPPREETVFSVGGKGYFENPTTDLLAYFVDPSRAHGFRDLVLRALVECCTKEVPQSLALVHPPMREEWTANGNRLDLVVVGDTWVLALENKVQHGLINPFDDYEDHLKCKYNDKQTIFRVILSPAGGSPNDRWISVSYEALISAIASAMGSVLLERPFGKWHVILREFLVHLANETVEKELNMEQIDFVEHHYTDIAKVLRLRDDYHDFLKREGRTVLEGLFPDATISTTTHAWAGGPAIRHSLDRWPGRSNIVIYASAETGREGLSIHLYAYGIPNEEKIEGSVISTELEQWTEGRDIRCWRTRGTWQSHRELLLEFRRLAGKFDEYLSGRESNKGMQADAQKDARG